MNIKRIESAKNPALKPLLFPKRAGGAFVVEGPNLLEAALHSGRVELGPLFVTARALERHQDLIEAASRIAPALYEIPEHVMARISGVEAPPGMAALCTLSRAWSVDDIERASVIVVLDALGEPGNVGTIIRSAEAAGSGGVVVLPGTADPYSDKALRASAGATLRMPIVRLESIEALGGMRILIAEPRGGVAVYEADLRPPVAVVFGNEAHGASGITKFKASGTVSIPLAGRAESLNVAAAAAVVLFEALRQRGVKG